MPEYVNNELKSLTISFFKCHFQHWLCRLIFNQVMFKLSAGNKTVKTHERSSPSKTAFCILSLENCSFTTEQSHKYYQPSQPSYKVQMHQIKHPIINVAAAEIVGRNNIFSSHKGWSGVTHAKGDLRGSIEPLFLSI